MPEVPESFPVDPLALSMLKIALDGRYVINDNGEHELVGSDFTVHKVLEFYSGYDETKLVAEAWDDFGEPIGYTYPDPVFSLHDVIRALIDEVERLRDGKD